MKHSKTRSKLLKSTWLRQFVLMVWFLFGCSFFHVRFTSSSESFHSPDGKWQHLCQLETSQKIHCIHQWLHSGMDGHTQEEEPRTSSDLGKARSIQPVYSDIR